jgi:hypothetical protein
MTDEPRPEQKPEAPPGETSVNAEEVNVGGDVVAGNKVVNIHYHYPTFSTQPKLKITPELLKRNRRRLFISYKRGAKPDEPLALFLHSRLSLSHDVFIDQEMPVGTEWRTRIQAELEACDFLVVLLSEQSVHSEMVEYEISTAHHLSVAQGGKPRLLPVRVAYFQPFDYPLDAYLNHINWAVWKSEADNLLLLNELLTAITGGSLSLADVAAKAAVLQPAPPVELPRPKPFANPAQLERPYGTMDPESKFYVERAGDEICRRELARQGATVVIKAPRQMGKSSLLVRAAAQAKAQGKAVAFLDFQLLDESTLQDPAAFFKGFCHWMADELQLDHAQVEEFWKRGLGNIQLCTRYIERQVLMHVNEPVVLVMDEVDRMLESRFASDFFGMLRNWHNSRRAGNEWQQLDLLLVISTEPYLLIDDLSQSPFNVGRVIWLEDFDRAQVAALNERHGNPFYEAHLDRLMMLVGGHPYLVRQAMYRVAMGEYTAADLFARAAAADGPFGDHLRRHLTRFTQRPELQRAMRQVVLRQTLVDEALFYRLQGAGLVRRDEGRVMPRCGLYAAYFKEYLQDE